MSDTRCGREGGAEQMMRDAGLPADTLAGRRAALPLAVQELHRRVLTAIGEAGRPPVGADLAADAAALGVDLREALGALAAAELLFVTPDRGGVLGGVPFAAAPTAHQVTVRGGPTVSANCAVDALGIGAMLGKDTDVASVDPVTGQPVTAAQRGGHWTWARPTRSCSSAPVATARSPTPAVLSSNSSAARRTRATTSGASA